MKNLVFLLFVIWSVPLTAQNLFTPGYIVTAEGDTMRGLILEMSDAEMSRRLVFKSAKNAVIQEFDIEDLIGFRFETGREFERRLLLPKPGKKQDTTYIFAKNLLRGEIDVFVGRHFQKKNPDLFLDNNSKNASIQIYRSRDVEALIIEEFIETFKNDPRTLNNPLAVKFRERKLLRSIAAHNKTTSGRFPDSLYRENIGYKLDLIVGMPVNFSFDPLHFRTGIYFNRTRMERTSHFSALYGIIYQHREKKDIIIQGDLSDGELNKKWQLLNLMPIAVKFQGNSGIVRPYGYLGVGVALLKETNRVVENYVVTDDRTRWNFFPTINSGIGIKTRIGQQFLITELTPTINNIFLNIGLSL
ncbi:MAG TPA: hypothetical protein VLN46_07175 [Gillisia sp.]|nr:hypothetical protein [Gillisia sp.]